MATDRLSDFKLGIGVVIKADMRDVGRRFDVQFFYHPQVAWYIISVASVCLYVCQTITFEDHELVVHFLQTRCMFLIYSFRRKTNGSCASWHKNLDVTAKRRVPKDSLTTECRSATQYFLFTAVHRGLSMSYCYCQNFRKSYRIVLTDCRTLLLWQLKNGNRDAWIDVQFFDAVCLSVCMSDDNSRQPRRRKFIFVHSIYLDWIRFKFVYEGRRVKVKVTGTKSSKIPIPVFP